MLNCNKSMYKLELNSLVAKRKSTHVLCEIVLIALTLISHDLLEPLLKIKVPHLSLEHENKPHHTNM